MARIDEWLEPDKLTLLEAWARDGLTEEQIASNIGVSRTTLFNWKNKEINILNALKKGKEVVDIEVENALLKNATGFSYVEEVVTTQKEVIYKDGKRVKEISEPVVIEIKRYKQPDTTAQIYWLNNRKPDKWRNRQDKNNNDSLEKLDKLLEEQKNA